MLRQERLNLLYWEMIGKNSLLESAIGIGIEQNFGRIIRLDKNFVERAFEVGDFAWVGKEENALAELSKDKADRLSGVVKSIEGKNIDAAEIELLTGFESVQVVAIN